MKTILLTLIVALLTFGVVFAAEPTTAAENDPNLNEDANACYVGGTWAGQCETADIDQNGVVEPWEIEYIYEVGWYLIRYEYGLISRAEFPRAFIWALAPQASPSVVVVLPSCFDNAIYPLFDVQYTGTPNENTNMPRFLSNDGSCTDSLGPSLNYYIVVDDPKQCPLTNAWAASAYGFTTMPANFYICTTLSLP
ncbi:MAG: hypothetical protein IPO91_30485 [Chloroflexi bacterium]|nr:hypothetical protein [Chloroflexota bacterium]